MNIEELKERSKNLDNKCEAYLRFEVENRLNSCKSLSELLTMYFGLGMKEKQSIFNKSITVFEGTEFYRVRKAESFNNSNHKDPKEWAPVPTKFANQGRFNEKGESVLYVASDPDFLEREVRIKEGEAYYLAKYKCTKSFKVGTLFGCNNLINSLLFRIAMSVADPEELNERENDLIERYFDSVKNKPWVEQTSTLLSPLYMHKILPNLYDITNKIGRIVKQKYDCGFRYSSVYFPIEYSGGSQILTFNGPAYGNYVLSPKGYENIELVGVEKKTCRKCQSLEILINEFAKD